MTNTTAHHAHNAGRSDDDLAEAAGHPVPPLLVTVEQAARMLSISRAYAYKLIMAGAIESVTIGRSRRIPAAAVERYVAHLCEAK